MTKMKKLLLFLILLTPLSMYSQGEASWWFFGQNASLDFNSGAPLPGPTGSLNTFEGCSTISDECGNLLMYSDGTTVWDRNGNAMPNGTGLSGNSSSAQSAIIIPDLGSTVRYFVITISSGAGLRYSIVDMSLNSGLGDVVAGRRDLLIQASTQEKVTAAYNDSQTFYWILTFDGNGTYSAYPAGGGIILAAQGVDSPLPTTAMSDARGYIRLSPDASKVSNTSIGNAGTAYLADFDNATGVVSNPIPLTNTTGTTSRYYGTEFSPNSQLVYLNGNTQDTGNGCGTGNTREILQYEINGGAMWNSRPNVIPTNATNNSGRGALQLGIDGMIYHARTCQPWLGVIRSPNLLGGAAGYVDDGVALATPMQSREGLPPFITSFFEPSFLAQDANNGSGGGNNGNQTDYCDGSLIQFNSSASGLCATATVLWDFGDGNTSTQLNPTHLYAGPGVYTVSLTVTSGFYSATATQVIYVYENPIINPVPTQRLCDSDGSGDEPLDLVTVIDPIVYGTQSTTDFTISYFLTQNNADNNVGSINSPYLFPLGTTTVYARISNNTNPPASIDCFVTDTFDVIVSQAGGITLSPAVLNLCDADNDGFETFDLTTSDSQVFPGGSAGGAQVTYHPTSNDANNGTNAITNFNSYVNATPTSEVVYVRAVTDPGTACQGVDTIDITLNVYDSKVANPVPDQRFCDNGNDGTEDILLTDIDATVLGTQNASDSAITYHLNQSDADTNSSPQTSPFALTGNTTIYVRIENTNFTDCYDTTSINLFLDTQAVANTVTEFRLCDDISNNGSEVFDLNTKISEVLGSQTAADFNVEFFVSQADADLGSAGGATPVSLNYSSAGQTMYVRIENINNINCFDTTTFDLIVDELPLANTPATLDLCDDTSNDGVENVDLSVQFDNDVLNGQTSTNFVVTYHANQTDADNDSNPLTSPYQVSLGTTNLVVRVDNLNNESCAATAPITIILNEQAIANSVADYRLCDDVSNDGQETFDLSTLNPQILDTQNAADFTIEYFANQSDADLGTVGGATALPTMYTSGTSTIIGRIQTNSNTSCYDTISINLFVDTTPQAGVQADIIVCDDPSNDGVEDVDLSQFDSTILNGQSASNFVVSYHASQADADNDASPLSSPYSVSASTPRIFVRIDNVNNNSCYTTTSFNFVIAPTPTANAVNDMVLCDDPTNDDTESFDLSMADSQVLGNQNPSDFTITYHPTQNDADNNSNALPVIYNNGTNPETVYVRIEAVANPVCADFTSFTLTVSEQPTAGFAPDIVGCDDPSNDGFEDFDFSQQDGAVLNGQSASDFEITYHLNQADADSNSNALPVPYTNTSRAQTIYARIQNRNNPDCYDVSFFEIEVFERPDINNQGPITICAGIDEVLDAGPGYSSYLWSTGETTQTITVNSQDDYTVTVTNSNGCDTTATIRVIESDIATIERIAVNQFEVNTNTLEAIVTGPGDYEFSLDNFVYQDSPRFNNLVPGFYTVYVKDKNGCGTVSQDAVIIGGPPYFTPNSDGYHDTWQVTAIETVPDANIYIFDRYGKLLKQISPTGAGWDGTYNGNPMPSSDYWYMVELSDGRSFRGHFALKR